MGLLNFITKGVRVEKKQSKRNTVVEVPNHGIFEHVQPHEGYPETIQQEANVGLQNGTSVFYDSPAASPLSGGGQFERELSGPTLGGRNILVVVPRTNEDVTHIVQNLQNGEACVINLENIEKADAQRRLDFLSGVICALGGTIRALDEKKYILTPQGLGVRG